MHRASKTNTEDYSAAMMNVLRKYLCVRMRLAFSALLSAKRNDQLRTPANFIYEYLFADVDVDVRVLMMRRRPREHFSRKHR